MSYWLLGANCVLILLNAGLMWVNVRMVKNLRKRCDELEDWITHLSAVARRAKQAGRPR